MSSGPPEQGGQGVGRRQPTPKVFSRCVLEVFFLKELTKNVREN